MSGLFADKYAAFIWPAYGISALAFLGLTVTSLLHARRWRKRAEERAKS